METAISKVQIAHLPTPVDELTRLSLSLGGPKILVKRDDQTGLAFGGNKTRKLEYLCAAALAEGSRTLITAGAIQSNHCRQTAAAAAQQGMECILVLTGDPPRRPDGNTFLDLLLGAELVRASKEARTEALEQTFQKTQEAGRRPYLVPYGGSSSVGAAAYAYALGELAGQGVNPDWIVFPSSSGGTQAGLVLGAKMFGFTGSILGISVDEPAPVLKSRVADLATQTAELLGEEFSFSPDEILVNADYLGGGYGVMGEPEREAIRLFARKEALLLDPVYTGRAAAGLINLIGKGFFTKNDNVLFWHTGGTPALFSEKYRDALLK